VDKAKNSYTALLSIFNKLTIQQRLMLGGISVVAVVLLVFILFAFNEPNYTTLYSNLAGIQDKDEDVAFDIKRLMFLFDDIIHLQDRDIQRILKEVDRKDLGLSLKVADERT